MQVVEIWVEIFCSFSVCLFAVGSYNCLKSQRTLEILPIRVSVDLSFNHTINIFSGLRMAKRPELNFGWIELSRIFQALT